MIKSFRLEKHVLSGILQHQNQWCNVEPILKDGDFYSKDSKVNTTIFKILRNSLNQGLGIDEIILIEKINQLGVTFPDSIDIGEYIRSLAFMPIKEESFISAVRDLKIVTARREIYEAAKNVADYVKACDPSDKYAEIITKCDEIYNGQIQKFETLDEGPVEIMSQMEDFIEELGNNPPEQLYYGPHKRLNDTYDSLLQGGNISVICARGGLGKTTWGIDYCTYASFEHGVPVLHLDNGEMSKEELLLRQCAALSGIPTHLLKTGKWRRSSYGNWSAEEVVKRVRSAFERVKQGECRIYYENVSGMSSEEMCGLVKRFYYSKIGRGNPLFLCFDYIKADYAGMAKNDNWLLIGKLVDQFKQLIHRELSFDDKNPVSMMTFVQSNRSGITGSRSADSIIDDESVASLSDAIMHFCSFFAVMRKKVPEEIAEYGEQFGNLLMKVWKARHLGEMAERYLHDVKMPDGSYKKNFINFQIDNFKVTEKGDLQDWVDAQREDHQIEQRDNSELPIELQ